MSVEVRGASLAAQRRCWLARHNGNERLSARRLCSLQRGTNVAVEVEGGKRARCPL